MQTKKQLEYAAEWKTMISMENGLRTLNIASLNPDSMRETATQQEIVKGLAKKKIHIAEIQDTHITQDKSYMVDNYRIITAANKSEAAGIVTGGAAIMIHERLRQHITQITRQCSRSLRVTLDRSKSKMPIRVISTYAPHNGRTEVERRQQWEDVASLLSTTSVRHLTIWGADAIGQLENRNQEEICQKGTCRPENNRTLRKSKRGGKRKRRTAAHNTPQTTEDTDGDVGEAENSSTRQMEEKKDPAKANREKRIRKIHDNMDKSGRKYKKQDRLHNDQRKIQKHDKESTKQYLMACKYGPESETPSTDDADLLQSRREI